jgi:hypothetical protein
VLRARDEAHLLTWTPPGRLQITCVDASRHLAERFGPPAGVVLFSGTLKPFACYARLSGLAQCRSEEIPSPFPAEHRCLLVVPQISTLYRRRDRETPRVAEFLSKVLPLRHGNYLIFFPSFDFSGPTGGVVDSARVEDHPAASNGPGTQFRGLFRSRFWRLRCPRRATRTASSSSTPRCATASRAPAAA